MNAKNAWCESLQHVMLCLIFDGLHQKLNMLQRPFPVKACFIPVFLGRLEGRDSEIWIQALKTRQLKTQSEEWCSVFLGETTRLINAL